jgi:ParB/RepB/Spo0J family partition protein
MSDNTELPAIIDVPLTSDEETPALVEEENAYSYPAEPRPPLQVHDISLADIAELENVRPEYYGIDELAESLHAQNQLHPVCVRPAPDGAEHGKPYELVYGYRRVRAARQLGWTDIRAIIRDIPDERLLEIMITENLQRADMSPVAEARAMRSMIELGGMKASQVAARLGVSRSHVSHRLKLLDLRPEVMQLVDSGELKASAGESIAALDEKKQLQVAKKAVKSGLSVQRIDAIVRTVKDDKVDMPPEELAPIERVLAEDVVELPYLKVREDFTRGDWERANVYILLRNGMDQEMLEYLREHKNIRWESLWTWVRELSDDEARVMRNRMIKRYLESAHRYPTIDLAARADLGEKTEVARPQQLALPSIDDLLANEEAWWDDNE